MRSPIIRLTVLVLSGVLAGIVLLALVSLKLSSERRATFLAAAGAQSDAIERSLDDARAAITATAAAMAQDARRSPTAQRALFADVAADAILAQPYLSALAFFEPFRSQAAARAAGAQFTDEAISADGVFFAPTQLALSRSAMDEVPFAGGRLNTIDAADVAASIASAREFAKTGAPTWLVDTEGRPTHLLLTTAAARAGGNGRRIGVVAALINARNLTVETAQANWPLVPTARIGDSVTAVRTEPRNVGGVIHPHFTHHDFTPIGAQGLVLTYDTETLGLFGVGLAPSILALSCGGLLSLGIGMMGRSQRAATRKLNRVARKSEFDAKAATAKLEESEQRFRMLAESTGAIPWAADVRARRFEYVGPQIEMISGYPARSWFAPGFWVDHVHPEDRQHFLVNALRGVKPGKEATCEYRVRSADGRVLHIRNTFTLLPPKNPKEPAILAQGFMLDITELKIAQAAQERLKREAEAANRSKSEFLANMSHELRTPLNVVIGFSEVMKDEIFGPLGARYRDYAVSIHSSGKHLLDLINDVLDLSRIEAGKIELIEEETDISDILASCRTLLHERASSHGLHIRLEIPAPLPMIMADGRRIKQVVINLLSNAIKFTPPGGRVTLRAQIVHPRGLGISIIDTGIGMSQTEIEVAMEQFGQIDSELSRQHDGTGLGLPIARSLTELHGGEVSIESKKDIGTKVTMWLPLSRMLEPPAEQSA